MQLPRIGVRGKSFAKARRAEKKGMRLVDDPSDNCFSELNGFFRAGQNSTPEVGNDGSFAIK